MKVANWAMFVILAVILFLSGTVLVAASNDLHVAAVRTERLLHEMASFMHESYGIAGGDVKLADTEREYLDRVETLSAKGLSDSTVAFLLTIFSVGLVSVGAYVLTASRDNLHLVEYQNRILLDRVKNVRRFALSGSFMAAVRGHLFCASQLVWRLRANDNPDLRADVMWAIRDSLHFVRKLLDQGQHDECSIDETHNADFVDYLYSIQNQLSDIGADSAELRGPLADCAYCLDILGRREFTERFDRDQKAMVEIANAASKR